MGTNTLNWFNNFYIGDNKMETIGLITFSLAILTIAIFTATKG